MKVNDMLDSLKALAGSDYYPFHMPGHKRNDELIKKYGLFPDGMTPYDIDITEIDGFDDLHDAEGIIRSAENEAASLIGAGETIFSVNGSTCGLLAAIGGTIDSGDAVIMTRNCHKAVYHAMELFGIRPYYLLPPLVSASGIFGNVSSAGVEAIFNKLNEKGIRPKAVIITSPTYEGVVSDIATIARIAHDQGALLIVDEAHGAHFGLLSDRFPANAISLGADISVQSFHKTLPCYTTTAVVNINRDICDTEIPERISHELDILETSSPSYILMAGIEQAVKCMRDHGRELAENYVDMLDKFYKTTADLNNIRINNFIHNENVFDFDMGKIVIEVPYKCGAKLYERLQSDYHLILEMRSRDYALAMTSVFDKAEGFERLANALHELDDYFINAEPCNSSGAFLTELPEKKYDINEAIKSVRKKGRKFISLRESEGKISADYVYFYPPGVPILTPGEIINDNIIEYIASAKEAGVLIKGGSDGYGTYICNDG